MPVSNEARAALKSVFGHDTFRPLQEEIVEAMLDRRDVLVLMPTGGGKSLCYQLPALVSEGLTVVVSPLIALMKDQVDRLHGLGVPAAFLNSSMDPYEQMQVQAAVAEGKIQLLYVAPERLVTQGFMNLLGEVPLARFAVDEAHCISEWGHDFRPEYRQLGELRKLLANVPVAAFTATATPRVEADIAAQLGLRDPVSFRGSFNRPNLFYQVWPKAKTYDRLARYLKSRRTLPQLYPEALEGLEGRGAGLSGIIYCISRQGTEDLAERLREDGFGAVAYHAGLESEDRRERQEAFAKGQTPIIVATIAFGMGVDKPDVRFVIHYDLPRNLEGYYQESGRAGRDGRPSDCILFYSYGDAAKQLQFIQEKPQEEQKVARWQLDRMIAWAESRRCRRADLLAYFEEEYPVGRGLVPRLEGACCDNCEQPAEEKDYTVAVQKLLSAARRTGERYGLAYLANILTGTADARILKAGHQKLPTFGVGKEVTAPEWRYLATELAGSGYVSVTPDQYRTIQVTPKGEQVLFKGEKVFLPGFRSGVALKPARGGPDRYDPALFEELRQLRKQIAGQQGLPPYVVFHDRALQEMAARVPTTAHELRAIPGVGDRKLADYGDTFLEAITAYRRRTPGAGTH